MNSDCAVMISKVDIYHSLIQRARPEVEVASEKVGQFALSSPLQPA